MRGLSASYTEEKHLSLLAVPLSSRGKLYYRTGPDGADGQLVRVVEAPEKSKLSVSERELKISDSRGTEVIDLRQSDRVRLFVTSLMQVFRGDGAALARHYVVRYRHVGEQGGGWRLDLTPKKPPLDKMLRSLSLRGAVAESDAGTKTSTDVIAAQQSLTAAQVAASNARVDVVQGAYNLLAAMGLLSARDLQLAVRYYVPEREFENRKLNNLATLLYDR